jgi:hypothetical protein
MLTQDKEARLILLFVELDDFCIALENWKKTQPSFQGSVTRKPVMSDSELLSILVFYQYSGMKCFQYYYRFVVSQMKSYYPRLVSYERFVALIPRLLPGLYVFLQFRMQASRRNGFYFIDSKKLPACDNRRIHSHKVFEEVAGRGKTSTGWFYGLKVHLVINNYGELVNCMFTAGNVADNNHEVLTQLLEGLKGECYGDKGYLSKLFEQFYRQGLHLITKAKSNMKNKLIPLSQYMKLRKRAVIESVNDILMTVFDIDHTRHRSPINALAHMFSALIAYCFYPTKPCVYVEQKQQKLVVG